jgi:hypothetical protein
MMSNFFDRSQGRAAKVFGLVYLPSFLLLAAINFGILQPLVSGPDPAQVARNILAHETLFRAGLVGITLYSVAVLVLSTSLYVILKPIDRNLALFATFSRLAFGYMWVLVVLNLFTALRLLSHSEYAGLPPDQLPVLARLYLSGFDQYYVGLLFWSLASGVGAYLWLKSRYIHRALAAFGALASAWCAGCTIALFIFPGFSKTVNLWWFDTPMVLFEIVLSFQLLFSRLRSRDLQFARSETQA